MGTKPGYVYFLIDPLTGCTRYVGWTSNPEVRFRAHCSVARKKSHCASWVKLLANKGTRPIMKVVCLCSETHAKHLEVSLISSLRRKGCRLTNMSDGGEGRLGSNPGAETRQKMAIASKRNMTAEKIQKMVAAGKASWTQERRDRIRAGVTAAWADPDKRAKFNASWSDERKVSVSRKVSEKLIGTKFTDERRNNISAALKSYHKRNPEAGRQAIDCLHKGKTEESERRRLMNFKSSWDKRRRDSVCDL